MKYQATAYLEPSNKVKFIKQVFYPLKENIKYIYQVSSNRETAKKHDFKLNENAVDHLIEHIIRKKKK